MLLGTIGLLSAAVSALVCFACDAFSGPWWPLWMLLGLVCSFLIFGVLAFLVLWFFCKIVDFHRPQEHDSKLYRGILRWYIPAAMTILQMKVHKKGLENIIKLVLI